MVLLVFSADHVGISRTPSFCAFCPPLTPPVVFLPHRRLINDSDARLACSTLCCRSAWNSLSQEVDLPGQGLDLVIHLGKEVGTALIGIETHSYPCMHVEMQSF